MTIKSCIGSSALIFFCWFGCAYGQQPKVYEVVFFIPPITGESSPSVFQKGASFVFTGKQILVSGSSANKVVSSGVEKKVARLNQTGGSSCVSGTDMANITKVNYCVEMVGLGPNYWQVHTHEYIVARKDSNYSVEYDLSYVLRFTPQGCEAEFKSGWRTYGNIPRKAYSFSSPDRTMCDLK